MRNWQRCIFTLMAGLCLCQLSHASGTVSQKLANQSLNTTNKVTFDTVTINPVAYSSAWNGVQNATTQDAVYDKIEAIASSSPFVTTSNVVNLSTATDNFTVGSATNLAKIAADGDTDEVQLLAQGHSTQSTNIMVVEKSDGTDLLVVSNDGTVTSTGTGTQQLTLGTGSQATYVLTGNVSGTDTTMTFGNGVITFNNDLVTAGDLRVTSGTSANVNQAGEIAIDTTDDQLVYYGAAKRVVSYERTACFIVEALDATDDNYAFFMTDNAITVTDVGCNCRGTCSTTATFTLEDRGGNAMTITGTNPTCATTGAATFATVTAGNALIAGEMAAFDVTNSPTASDTYTLCIKFTTDSV